MAGKRPLDTDAPQSESRRQWFGAAGDGGRAGPSRPADAVKKSETAAVVSSLKSKLKGRHERGRIEAFNLKDGPHGGGEVARAGEAPCKGGGYRQASPVLQEELESEPLLSENLVWSCAP